MITHKHTQADLDITINGKFWGVVLTGGADAAVVNIRNGNDATAPVLCVIKAGINETKSIMVNKGVAVNGLFADLISGTTPDITVFYS